jgi:serine O-acetyltransferase
LSYYLLKPLGAEVPVSVPVGAGTRLVHGGFGAVIHSKARFGKRVKIYPGVTVRRATVIGANAVLLESAGNFEIWAGAPARCVGRSIGEIGEGA